MRTNTCERAEADIGGALAGVGVAACSGPDGARGTWESPWNPRGGVAGGVVCEDGDDDDEEFDEDEMFGDDDDYADDDGSEEDDDSFLEDDDEFEDEGDGDDDEDDDDF